MRKIDKSTEDTIRFNKWVKGNKSLKDWSDFASPESKFYDIYLQVRHHISKKEQNGLSSYTEKPLGNSIHIDHFRKRSIFQNLKFDYSNFLVDDRNENYGACFKDNHAGVSKDTFDGCVGIFCPVTENMADFIDFMLNGEVIPKKNITESDRKRVKETIRVFNLNHKSLKDLRSEIMRNIKIYESNGLSKDCIRKCMGALGFPTLINWMLNQTKRLP